MSGRGKLATLPAWMTNGSISATIASTSNSNSTTSVTSQPSSTPIQNVTVTSLDRAKIEPPPMLVPPTTSSVSLAYKNVNQSYDNSAQHSLRQPPSFIPLQTSSQIFIPPQLPSQYSSLNISVPSVSLRPNPPSTAPPNHLLRSSNIANTSYGAAAPNMPVLPRQISGVPSNSNTHTIDPSNDVSAWSEFSTPDGRQYWYNRVTLVSTYDKPFCLKTPEERSIPPCPWKEYATADGKKYYSNGVESMYVNKFL